ncbi:hypothetical protein GGI35DRAFT_487119 [Trichoderma velutinum]
METRRFTPSPNFIAKAAADPAVKAFLKMESTDEVFVVTGVKIAKGLAITTIKETEKGRILQARVGLPIPQLQIETRAERNRARCQAHTQTIDGPTIFAFQVERLRLTWKNVPTSKGYLTNAVFS